MNYDEAVKDFKEWFINEKNGNEADFAKFLEDCQWSGFLNPDESFAKKIPYTKANREKLYKQAFHPVKITAKQLDMTYKELAEEIGYTEGALKMSVIKDEVSAPMKKALELLVRAITAEKQLSNLDNNYIKQKDK